MFLIILHSPGYTSDKSKRFFVGFAWNRETWKMKPDWESSRCAILSFAEAKQAVKDLLAWYAEHQPDYECSFGTYEIASMEMIASTSWGK